MEGEPQESAADTKHPIAAYLQSLDHIGDPPSKAIVGEVKRDLDDALTHMSTPAERVSHLDEAIRKLEEAKRMEMGQAGGVEVKNEENDESRDDIYFDIPESHAEPAVRFVDTVVLQILTAIAQKKDTTVEQYLHGTRFASVDHVLADIMNEQRGRFVDDYETLNILHFDPADIARHVYETLGETPDDESLPPDAVDKEVVYACEHLISNICRDRLTGIMELKTTAETAREREEQFLQLMNTAIIGGNKFSSLDEILEETVKAVKNEIFRNWEQGKGFSVDIGPAGHTAASHIDQYLTAAFLESDHYQGKDFSLQKEKISRPVELKVPPHLAKLFKDSHEKLRQERQEQKELKKIRRSHVPLSVEDQQHIFPHLRVRIAGRDMRGGLVQTDKEIAKFQGLEYQPTQWKKLARQHDSDPHAPRDEYGFGSKRSKAFREFHEHGGHIGPLSEEQIRYIMRYGMVAFIELEVRKDLWVTVGSVSALTRPPYTTTNDFIRRNHENLHWLFPNYDFADLGIRKEATDPYVNTINETIMICRSTIAETMRDPFILEQMGDEKIPPHLEDKELRRMGFAALGKAHIFHAAQHFGAKYVTFNIGTILDRKESKGLEMGNKPSQLHNQWATQISWRKHVDEIVDNVIMMWGIYRGEIEKGMDTFMKDDGILVGKGYKKTWLAHSFGRFLDFFEQDLESGRHAPWGELGKKYDMSPPGLYLTARDWMKEKFKRAS